MNVQQIIKNSMAKLVERLSEHDPDAYELLLTASVYRTPVSKDFLFAHLDEWEETRFEKALKNLRDRNLIKSRFIEEEEQFFLEKMIREIALAHQKI